MPVTVGPEEVAADLRRGGGGSGRSSSFFPISLCFFFWWKGEGLRRTCKQRQQEGVESLDALLPLATGALLPLVAAILVAAGVDLGGCVLLLLLLCGRERGRGGCGGARS